jgi:hypothetical protein
MIANTMTNWAVTPTPNQGLHRVILCSTMTLQLIGVLVGIIVSQRNYMKLGANRQKMAGHDGRTVGLENKGSVAVTRPAHCNPITNVHVSQSTANNLKLVLVMHCQHGGNGYPINREKKISGDQNMVFSLS